MNNNPNQPREFDAVLGGEAPPPASGVVLGGIEGVKSRLKSSNFEVKIAAIEDAINYGDTGLDLVIKTLNNSSQQVQRFIARLLKRRGGKKGKQALLDFNYNLYFTKLEDWTREDFNPEVGIINPEGKAYTIKLKEDITTYKLFELENFQVFLKNPKVSNVEALICQGWHGFYSLNPIKGSSRSINALIDAQNQLSNVKALFIGDGEYKEYMKTRLELGDITQILYAYPQLEVLQVHACFWGDSEVSKQVKHENLKTLIIETANISNEAISQIGKLVLPALEYLELWFGRRYEHSVNQVIDSLLSILSGGSSPNLTYLGLRSSEYADEIAFYVTESLIIKSLKVLDLSMGNLTDKGVDFLLKSPAVNKLHTLNISNNCISSAMIEKISQLNCQVIAEPQGDIEPYFGYRYCAIYE